jgi:hypothetical protein
MRQRPRYSRFGGVQLVQLVQDALEFQRVSLAQYGSEGLRHWLHWCVIASDCTALNSCVATWI